MSHGHESSVIETQLRSYFASGVKRSSLSVIVTLLSIFVKEGGEELRQEVNAAFDRLAARYNPIVMEGAGSISEINLRDTDLVNMPMAVMRMRM